MCGSYRIRAHPLKLDVVPVEHALLQLLPEHGHHLPEHLQVHIRILALLLLLLLLCVLLLLSLLRSHRCCKIPRVGRCYKQRRFIRLAASYSATPFVPTILFPRLVGPLPVARKQIRWGGGWSKKFVTSTTLLRSIYRYNYLVLFFCLSSGSGALPSHFCSTTFLSIFHIVLR